MYLWAGSKVLDRMILFLEFVLSQVPKAGPRAPSGGAGRCYFLGITYLTPLGSEWRKERTKRTAFAGHVQKTFMRWELLVIGRPIRCVLRTAKSAIRLGILEFIGIPL